MSANIFAYTAPGCNYPEYISVNEDDEKNVTITVREARQSDGGCGHTVCVMLTQEQFKIFSKQLTSFAFNTLVQR
jgi:hypothetical protein